MLIKHLHITLKVLRKEHIKTILVWLIYSFCIIESNSSYSQNSHFSNKKTINRLKTDIKTLSSRKMFGREAGTIGEIKARNYIVKRINEIGIKPYGKEEFHQVFFIRDSIIKSSYNVLGFLDNQSQKTILICAHYDHLGYEINKRNRKIIYNGADDNASGVAAILELALFFKNNEYLEKNNFLFIAFSSEEKGMLGSKYFMQNPIIDTSKINFVINIDMIGRMEKNMPLTIEGLGSSKVLFDYFKMLDFDKFNLRLKKRINGPSDHSSFTVKFIPALHFWTGKHNDYHKFSDDAHKISYKRELKIILFLEKVLMELDLLDKVKFTK